MAHELYADTEIRQFVCDGDSCTEDSFFKGLTFHQFDEVFHKRTLAVCLVESVLSAPNSYTGVFARNGDTYKFQFTSYGTGVKVGKTKDGVPMLREYGFDDARGEGLSISLYIWNGKEFSYLRDISVK
jgi:hypothetical protein